MRHRSLFLLTAIAVSFSATAARSPRPLILVPATADLAIAFQPTPPSSVTHTQNATITFVVRNNDKTFSALNTTATLNFTNAAFVSATASAGTCSGTGPVTCSIGTLGAGLAVTISLVLNANSLGTITTSGSVSSTTSDPDLTNNNTGTASITVTPIADLGIAVTDSPDPVYANGTVTYAVTVSNAGPDTAASPVVSASLTNGTINSAPAGCTTTATTATCGLASLTSGNATTINLIANPPAQGGTMSLSANVQSSTADPATGNNSASQSTTVIPRADVAITKSGPATATPSTTIAYDITVTNNGPSDAAGVTITDPTPSRLTFVSATGACASFPCNVGALAAGLSKSVHATYSVAPGPATTITNTATVSATTADQNSGNNTASVSSSTGCPPAPTGLLPVDGVTNIPTSGTLQWSDTGAVSYNVYLGPAGSGCSIFLGSSATNSIPYAGLTAGKKYEWRVESVTAGCPTTSSPCSTFSTTAVCPTVAPVLIAPAGGATVGSPVTFSWTAVTGATSYTLFAAQGGAPKEIGSTSGTSLTASLPNGSVTWFVVANADLCAPLQSQSGNFTVCTPAVPPQPSVVATAATGQVVRVEWGAVDGASRYEVDEATKSDFSDAKTTSTTATHADYQHSVTQPSGFYYRVRSFSACDQKLSANSETLRTVILPVITSPAPSANAPAGSTQIVVMKYHLNGVPGGTVPFTASVDKPWLTVTPSSGFVPPAGLDLEIDADPSTLPNGTSTGTLFISITGASSSRFVPTATSTAVPVSVNLVTPVSPKTKGSASPKSLIIPSVGHLDGVNSQWRSDMRVTNTSSINGKVQLIFTPSDPSQAVRSTSMNLNAGDTAALDDIVRNWFGSGALNDAGSGALEIRPPDSASGAPSLTLVASSRTFNSTANGTYGQYIPAIPFASFVGKDGPILGLQQLAQNADYRTNIGFVEAAGKSVSLVITAFGGDGTKLFDFPLDLKANEQRQLNAFLATQNVTNLSDGRLEVKVVGGDGKITAYASIIDNHTGDPLLVSGEPLGASTATRYVLPGVAALSNGFANWRSDVRIFNAGSAPESATLTLFPLNNSGDPVTAALTVNPGETKQLDSIVTSTFNLASAGGALHVTTDAPSSLVVTGRTYNLTSDGATYGQFIPAVTPAEAIGKGGTLHILQVEDSVRYRTNVGIAEVGGKDLTVEVSVVVPESKVAPTAILTLKPYEYRQMDIVSSLGLHDVYNVRVSVKAVDGDGRVTAYGSVIDMITQDPTYVQAQQ